MAVLCRLDRIRDESTAQHTETVVCVKCKKQSAPQFGLGLIRAQVAQLAAQPICNRQVGGSNPPLGSTQARLVCVLVHRSGEASCGCGFSARLAGLVADVRTRMMGVR